jgi:hypothetical protein
MSAESAAMGQLLNDELSIPLVEVESKERSAICCVARVLQRAIGSGFERLGMTGFFWKRVAISF